MEVVLDLVSYFPALSGRASCPAADRGGEIVSVNAYVYAPQAATLPFCYALAALNVIWQDRSFARHQPHFPVHTYGSAQSLN